MFIAGSSLHLYLTHTISFCSNIMLFKKKKKCFRILPLPGSTQVINELCLKLLSPEVYHWLMLKEN